LPQQEDFIPAITRRKQAGWIYRDLLQGLESGSQFMITLPTLLSPAPVQGGAILPAGSTPCSERLTLIPERYSSREFLFKYYHHDKFNYAAMILNAMITSAIIMGYPMIIKNYSVFK
jgi:hypothetical protein